MFFYQDNKSKDGSTEQMLAAAKLMQGQAPLSGGNIITDDLQVVSDLGKPVNVSVMPNSEEAPRSVSVEAAKLLNEAIKININNNSFQPNLFRVKAGAPVSLAFISADKKVHVVTFADADLAALAFAVSAGQARAMTFNVPEKPGNYIFGCDVPGHRAAGEKGLMIIE